jgi:hypothetical protein
LFRSLNVAPDYKFALVRLAEQVERLEHDRQHQQMLFGGEPPPSPSPAPPPLPLPPGAPRHKRERHLRAVQGNVALAVLGAAGAWLAGHGAKRALAAAGAVALAGTAVTAPSLMAPRGPAPLVAAEGAAGPLRAHHRHAPASAPLSARRAHRHRRHAHASPSPSRSPSPGPSPSPSPGVIIPSPSPSAPVSGLINQGVPSLTSSVLNPGPRLLAGSTVTVKQAVTSAR